MPFTFWVGRVPFQQAQLDKPLHETWSSGDRSGLLSYIARNHPMRELDGSIRLHRAKSRAPLCLLREHRRGDALVGLEVSVSLTTPDLNCVLDSLDLGVDLARGIRGLCFEPLRGEHVTLDTVNAFVNTRGAWVTEVGRAWLARLRALAPARRAYLELPLGDVDTVDDYFSFTCMTNSVAPSLGELLKNTPSHLKLEVIGHSAVLCEPDTDVALVRVLRADDRIVVRPEWMDRPFAVLARETLEAVTRVEQYLGVNATYHRNPLTVPMRAELAWRAGGFGCDFRRWLLATGRDGLVATTELDGSPRHFRLGGGPVDPRATAEFMAMLERANAAAPRPTSLELTFKPDVAFTALHSALEELEFRRTWPWGPYVSPDEPSAASWETEDTTLHFTRDEAGTRTLRGTGPGVGSARTALREFASKVTSA